MAGPYTAKADRRGERLTQARRFAEQAKRHRTTAWYVQFTIMSIGAGASFDAFGRSVGFFYALGLAVAFVVSAWGTVRILPSLAGELSIERHGRARKLLTLVSVPVTTRGPVALAAAVPAAIALVKTVGFYALGGAMIVLLVMGVALLAAWVLDKR
jgi:hypothetical protein